MIFWIMFIIFVIPVALLFPAKVIGRKHLKIKGKHILCCNHMGGMDPMLIVLHRGKRIVFLTKRELFKNKFASWFLKSLGAAPISRDNPQMSEIKNVFSILRSNKPICIFPQGTRKSSPAIIAEDIKNGVAMFSIKTDTPVLPTMFVKKNRLFVWNKLLVGEPIYPQGYTMDKASMEEYSKLICDKMNALIEVNNDRKKK